MAYFDERTSALNLYNLYSQFRQRPFLDGSNDPAMKMLQVFLLKRAILRLQENA
jgi:hypothetical protein